MILSGNLGHLDPAFEGWTCRDGCLASPDGWLIPIDEIRAVPFLRQQLAVYQAENRRIKESISAAQVAASDEQPQPEGEPAIAMA
jgi:hypothetical protein